MKLKRILLPLLVLAAIASAGPILNSWIPIGQSSSAAVWQLTGTGTWNLNYSSPLPPNGGVVDIYSCSAQVRAHLEESGTGTSISDTLRATSGPAYFLSGTTPTNVTGVGGLSVQIDSAGATTICNVEVRL